MAITFERLQELLKQQKFHFLLDPDRPVVRARVGGAFGDYEFAIRVELEGRFLQFRTVRYMNCREGHPQLGVVLRILGHLNYDRRLVKFGWDPSDGEIVAYADMWIMDNDVTQEQIGRIMGNYFPTVDLAYERLRKAIETGKDGGDPTSEEIAARVAGKGDGKKGGGPAATETPRAKAAPARPAPIPPALKGLLDRLKKKPGADAPEPTPAEPPIREI